jgi:KUP system potassium uptake protein
MQFAAVVFAVAFFGSSSALATAYGIAVTSTMVITTLMTFFVVRFAWKYPWWVSLAATGFFLLVDVAFFSANALKILSGGWFTLALAAALFTIMVTWKEGRDLMRETMREEALPLREFLDSVFISPPMRAHGTAVFMTSEVGVTPAALLHNLKHNNVLHETNLFVTARSHEVPWVGFDKRVELESIGRDCWQVVLNFGFKNDLDVPAALQLLRHRGVDIDEMTTSYFLSRETVVPTVGSGMAPWREKLFAGMHRNAAAAADFLNLPPNRVVELGSKVQI